MRRIFWVVVVMFAVMTVAFAPQREPARPEPDGQSLIQAVFGG